MCWFNNVLDWSGKTHMELKKLSHDRITWERLSRIFQHPPSNVKTTTHREKGDGCYHMRSAAPWVPGGSICSHSLSVALRLKRLPQKCAPVHSVVLLL